MLDADHEQKIVGFDFDRDEALSRGQSELELLFHAEGKLLLSHQPPSTLKILCVAQMVREVRSFLGAILNLQPLTEYRLKNEGNARAMVTLDESDGGGKLCICESPGEVAYKPVQLRNETLCRKFKPDVPIMLLHGSKPRILAPLLQQARMMRIVSPHQFVEHGVIMFNNLVEVNTDECHSQKYAFVYDWMNRRSKYLHEQFELLYGAKFKHESKWLGLKKGERATNIPFVGGNDNRHLENLYDEAVNWRAKVWCTLLRRVPADLISTLYSFTNPAVVSLLSDAQLRGAIECFRHQRQEIVKIRKTYPQLETIKRAEEETKRIDARNSEAGIDEELQRVREYGGTEFTTKDIQKANPKKYDGKLLASLNRWMDFDV